MTQRAPHACYAGTDKLMVTQAERNRTRNWRRRERADIALMIRNDGRAAQRKAQKRVYASLMKGTMLRLERAICQMGQLADALAKEMLTLKRPIAALTDTLNDLRETVQ
jgi:hypothetical protein